MNNLENIEFDEVTNYEGVSYIHFRKTLKPDYAITWLHIGGWIFFLVLICIICVYTQSIVRGLFWITIPVFSVIIGFSIASLNLFIHEAGHFHLHPDKKINDILASLFLCSWMGIDIKSYRKTHWLHHDSLSTPADTENSYFQPITGSFIAESLTGIHLLRILSNRKEKQNKKMRQRTIAMFMLGAILNFLFLGICIYHGYWQFTITWVSGMLVFFPFFFSLRQILEHRNELAFNNKDFYTTARGKLSRIFTNSLFSRLFGAAGFNKHMIHHWDPQLPSTSLKEVEDFLCQCDATKDIILSSRSSYLSVFKKIAFKKSNG